MTWETTLVVHENRLSRSRLMFLFEAKEGPSLCSWTADSVSVCWFDDAATSKKRIKHLWIQARLGFMSSDSDSRGVGHYYISIIFYLQPFLALFYIDDNNGAMTSQELRIPALLLEFLLPERFFGVFFLGWPEKRRAYFSPPPQQRRAAQLGLNWRNIDTEEMLDSDFPKLHKHTKTESEKKDDQRWLTMLVYHRSPGSGATSCWDPYLKQPSEHAGIHLHWYPLVNHYTVKPVGFSHMS